ncbi:MAG: hypothetical protein WCC04_13230 [Terriglobales bacterium]
MSPTVDPINTTTTITRETATRTGPTVMTVSFTVANGLAAAAQGTLGR